MILCYSDYEPQGRRLAAALDMACTLVDIHQFPDGESRIRMPASLPDRVFLVRTLDQPNSKLTELLITAENARALGAREVILIAPYLCYMRQDIAFRPGEAVSQRIIGKFLADHFDGVVTVDPHLHRVASLEEAVPCRYPVAITATGEMTKFLAGLDKPILLGPDAESEQWVSAVAAPLGLPSAAAHKTRLGDRQVQIALPPHLNFADQIVVLVDDMVSTGHTLMNVARQVKAAGARAVHALVTHALCPEEVVLQLHDSGIDKFWSSDSVSHPSNAVQLADLLAQGVRQIPN